jgi:hypothetical protein
MRKLRVELRRPPAHGHIPERAARGSRQGGMQHLLLQGWPRYCALLRASRSLSRQHRQLSCSGPPRVHSHAPPFSVAHEPESCTCLVRQPYCLMWCRRQAERASTLCSKLASLLQGRCHIMTSHPHESKQGRTLCQWHTVWAHNMLTAVQLSILLYAWHLAVTKTLHATPCCASAASSKTLNTNRDVPWRPPTRLYAK